MVNPPTKGGQSKSGGSSVTDQIQTETPAVPAPATAPKARAARKTAGAKPKATAKAAPKGKATVVKTARTPIPAGMTRSRGSLIPVSSGQCGFSGSKGQCANPGRWTRTAAGGRKVLSCTTHKNSTKAVVFEAAPKARRSRQPKVVATAAV